jgi:DNA-binding XRE family transcriptional regulator
MNDDKQGDERPVVLGLLETPLTADHRLAIHLLNETSDTVTLRRADFDALLDELEDAEDRIAVLEHHFMAAKGDHPPPLTIDEMDRLLAGDSPVRVWREKLGLTQRDVATAAAISQSHLAEIETGAKTGSVGTLKKLARVLKTDLDNLAPEIHPQQSILETAPRVAGKKRDKPT